MSKKQHGFLHGKLRLTNLLNGSEPWTRALDIKAAVDVRNFDFEKAFDCVPHLRMLHKQNELGICGRLHGKKDRHYQVVAHSQNRKCFLAIL